MSETSPSPDVVRLTIDRSLLRGLGVALAALVVLHVAAVVKHELIDRDGLLSRMLPGR